MTIPQPLMTFLLWPAVKFVIAFIVVMTIVASITGAI